MRISSRYVGTTLGASRFLFFVLYEDYVQAQQGFVRELDLYLERFARNLGDAGAVVKPFLGDIDQARVDVFAKPWTRRELLEIGKTPGLLMISTDFDSFSPRDDPWLLLHFGEREYGDSAGHEALGDALTSIAQAVREGEGDIFESARRAANEVGPSVGEVFELKPGIFGFSIDLRKASRFLLALVQSARTPHEG